MTTAAFGRPVVERFADLAGRILARPARLGPVRLVAVDGPSGAGKTQFAARLATALAAALQPSALHPPAGRGPALHPAALHPPAGRGPASALPPGAAVPIVHTDDLLDGWDDQLTFWPRLEEQVLAPLRCGRAARHQRYLWHRGRFAETPVTVAPETVVLLEGVTAARRPIRPELTLAVFVTAPAELRLRRAVARDRVGGDPAALVALRAYLERWRRIEDRHFAVDETAAHVDLVVDGAPSVAHDPSGQYVRLASEDQRA